MLKPISRSRPTNLPTKFPTNYSSSCARSVISNLEQELGLGLSQGDIDQLVQAIGAGGQAGVALALTIANSIANANYQWTPALVQSIGTTLNQGGNQGLQISQLIRLRISRIPLKR